MIMPRRGRPEAWPLDGVFGLIVLAALLALAHLPTRLVLGRDGIDAAFFMFRQHRDWHDIAALDVRRDRFGAWFRFAERKGASAGWVIWPSRAGFLLGSLPLEPHQLAMRVEAWRLARPAHHNSRQR